MKAETYERTYEDLKYLSKTQLEEIMSTFHCVKVPLTKKESEFIYYRKFPTERLESKTPGQAFSTQKNAPHQVNLNLSKPKGVLAQAKTLKYENPFLKEKKSDQQKFEETSKKIVTDLPDGRTLLVVSKDRDYQEGELREIF